MTVEGSPRGDAIPPLPQRAKPSRKGARCGASAGSPGLHRPHPGHTGRGNPATRPRGRTAGGGTAPDTRRPSQQWQASPPGDGPPPPPRHAAPKGHAGQEDSGGPPHPQARTRSTWERVCGYGGPTLSPWPACPVGAACRGGGGGPSPGGGWPATVVRGVWCQALSLPQPSVLWGGQLLFCDPCVPGAVGAGVGPNTHPTACALAGRRCSQWGWRKGVPGGGAFWRCEGRLRSGAPPPPTARPLGGLLGSATHVLRVRACGCGGPPLSSCPACPLGAACRGGGGGPSPGGLACHCCEGRLVSGAVPPPAVRPLGRVAGFPRPVCPGCGRCGPEDPALAPQRAPLRAGFARCGSGRGASPRGVPSTVMRGV